MKQTKHILATIAMLLCSLAAKAEVSVEVIDIANNADAMLYTNAKCTNTSYGDQFVGWHVLFDNDPSTFFHSEYSNRDSDDGLDHYIRVDLGEDSDVKVFSFTYTVRANIDFNSSYTPKIMIVEGANTPDGTYTKLATLNNLPSEGAAVYESPAIGNGTSYRYIRFRVTETYYNTKIYGHPFFFMAEFGMKNITGGISAGGTCGDNLIWALSDDGELVIEGAGKMPDYSNHTFLPWYDYRSSIKTITIKEGVTSIGNYAFWNCDGLSSITLPESVTSIGYDAFYYCSSLASITIPENSQLTSIGSSAFEGCNSLTKVCIANVKAWCKISFSGFYSNPLYYAHHLYLDGELIRKLVIPEGVTTIGNYAFEGCESLTSITLPEGVTSIGNYAFEDCSSLAAITIPENSQLTSIGESAFEHCSGLTAITIPEGVTSIGSDAFFQCSSLTTVHISSLEAWCNIDFSSSNANPLCYAKNLYINGELVTELAIPNSVTAIKDYAFDGCSSLASINIPESVTSIGDYAFYSCNNLTSITIPEGVTSIGGSAFYRCSSLTSITIPESVTSIGDDAFSYCSLTSITIPESVTSIGDSAFEGCNGLTAVSLPKSLSIIKQQAFYNCQNLKNIIIPENVEIIYQEAFASCWSLESIKVLATEPPFAYDNTFSDHGIELCVPEEAMEAYRTTAPWSNFTNIRNLEGEEVEVKQCAAPTIDYINGQVVLTCDTEGVEFVTDVVAEGAQRYQTSTFDLAAVYTITAYATKEGYLDSDPVTLTLCWVPCTEEHAGEGPNTNIEIPSRPVLIQTAGGVITLTGLPDGTEVAVYDTAGTLLAAATAENGTATLTTNLTTGSTAIVKIGGHSVKVIVK